MLTSAAFLREPDRSGFISSEMLVLVGRERVVLVVVGDPDGDRDIQARRPVASMTPSE